MDWFSSPIFIINLLFNTTHGGNLIKIRLKVEITSCSSVVVILFPVKDTLLLLILSNWKCAWISPVMHIFNYNCIQPCVFRTWLQVTWLCTYSNQARNRNMYIFLRIKLKTSMSVRHWKKPKTKRNTNLRQTRDAGLTAHLRSNLERRAAYKIKHPVYAH